MKENKREMDNSCLPELQPGEVKLVISFRGISGLFPPQVKRVSLRQEI